MSKDVEFYADSRVKIFEPLSAMSKIGLGLRVFSIERCNTAGRSTKNDFWLESAARRGIEFATNEKGKQ